VIVLSKKKRVYELAKELDIPSKDLIEELKDLGVEVKSHMSTVDKDVEEIVFLNHDVSEEPKKSVVNESNKKSLDQDKISIENEKKEVSNVEKIETEEIPEEKNEEELKIVKIVHNSSLKEVAAILNMDSSTLIKELFMKSKAFSLNQALPDDLIEEIAENKGYLVEFITEEEIDEIDAEFENYYKEKVSEIAPRPPIITIMGHVDHGKTTLLDYIIKTKVAENEKGGITQIISAYQIEIHGKKITFIDTPGHAAFTSLRARGAKVTDIVILIVAADDGVMNQTVEAYNHAKAANVPIIVAINKIDKKNANVDKVMNDLHSKLGIVPEEWGGSIPVVKISAKTGVGVDELLETILIVSELKGITAYTKGAARGVVLESRIDKQKGPIATLIVYDGILKKGDYVIAGQSYGRVKALFSTVSDSQLKEAKPGQPVRILGFSDIPSPGSKFFVMKNQKQAKKIVQKRKERSKSSKKSMLSLQNIYDKIEKNELKELRILLKADTEGSLHAVKTELSKFKSKEIRINFVHSAIGSVSENDIMLASASNAIIIAFAVNATNSVKDLAKKENVEIRFYDIIFRLSEDIEKALLGMLEPEYEEKYIGKGRVLKIFKASNIGTVIGTLIEDGYALVSGKVKVLRNNKEIFKGIIESIKHYKQEVKEIKMGEECGIKIKNFDSAEEGDILEFYTDIEKKKELEISES
jgi:translation initiation factor IF-2